MYKQWSRSSAEWNIINHKADMRGFKTLQLLFFLSYTTVLKTHLILSMSLEKHVGL